MTGASSGRSIRTGAPPALGITLFPTDRSIHPVQLAREVEVRGFESLFLPEHSHIPTSRESPWPGSVDGSALLPDYYSRINDQIVSLAMAAAVTEQLTLGTAVTLVPQHDPIWLAKQVATLDHLSGGRVVLGVGFGWNVEQMRGHGVDPDKIRSNTRDKVGLMRALWTDDVASYDSDNARLEPSWAWPKPAQPGGPAIVLGGGWGPVLFGHIAEWGDGWMPVSARSSIADRLGPLRRAFEDRGRDPDSIEIVLAGATTDPGGLASLGAEGVQRALLTIWSEDRDEVLRTLDEYARVKDQLVS